MWSIRSTLRCLLAGIIGAVLFASTMAGAPAPPAPTSCVAGPLPDSTSPSRAGFFREVLFAAPTARTPWFDDYTKGSYHIDKLDLAIGLRKEAERCGVTLEALVVVGPNGPLWSYNVLAFLRDGDSVRINSLVIPHARITGKATKHLSGRTLAEWFRQLAGC